MIRSYRARMEFDRCNADVIVCIGSNGKWYGEGTADDCVGEKGIVQTNLGKIDLYFAENSIDNDEAMTILMFTGIGPPPRLPEKDAV